MRWWLIGGVIGVLLLSAPIYAENPGQAPQNLRRAAIKTICLNPVGVVKKQGQRAWLEVFRNMPRPSRASRISPTSGCSTGSTTTTTRRAPDPSGPPPPRSGQSPDRRLRLPGPGAPQPHRLHRLPDHQGGGERRGSGGPGRPGRLPHPGPETLHPRRGRHPRGGHPGVAQTLQAPGRLASSLAAIFKPPPGTQCDTELQS